MTFPTISRIERLRERACISASVNYTRDDEFPLVVGIPFERDFGISYLRCALEVLF